MSRPPSQQWGHPTPERTDYFDPGRSQQPRMPYPPYPRPEPRQFMPQGPLTMPPGPRLPSLSGRLPDRGPDARYVVSSESSRHLYRQSVPQTLPLRTSNSGPANTDPLGCPSPYEDLSSPMSHGRDYDSYRGYDLESQHSSSSTTMPSPIYSEKSATGAYTSGAAPSTRASSSSHTEPPSRQRSRPTSYSMPSGFDRLLHHSPESSSSPPPPPPPPPPRQPRRPSTQSRYHLHVRQQPEAARACGAGDRDRRPVDPPPIVQILLTDFDPVSQEDRDILQDPRFTVGCLLFPVSSSSPRTQPTDADPTRSQRSSTSEGSGGIARSDDAFSAPLLSGKAFMSPFYVDEDPDPTTSPIHPSFSSSANIISRNTSRRNTSSSLSRPHIHPPATFFIFADLSIRSAGLYRLQFRLMNWGSVEDTGQSMPILAEAWSDPFRVYPAKDFPGMQDSSNLAEGLKALGFVELKTRGKGKGKGRRKPY